MFEVLDRHQGENRIGHDDDGDGRHDEFEANRHREMGVLSRVYSGIIHTTGSFHKGPTNGLHVLTALIEARGVLIISDCWTVQ